MAASGAAVLGIKGVVLTVGASPPEPVVDDVEDARGVVGPAPARFFAGRSATLRRPVAGSPAAYGVESAGAKPFALLAAMPLDFLLDAVRVKAFVTV